MVDAKGVVQTDYQQYGSWVVQVISWTDPKTWFIASETPLSPCTMKGSEDQFCYLNSRTIIGSDKDNTGTNVVLSFKPCQNPKPVVTTAAASATTAASAGVAPSAVKPATTAAVTAGSKNAIVAAASVDTAPAVVTPVAFVCQADPKLTAAWLATMSVQRIETSLTYLPDILTASSKTTVSKYALGVVTTLVAQDTLSQPNIYYNYRE